MDNFKITNFYSYNIEINNINRCMVVCNDRNEVVDVEIAKTI